jgi:hypothetical protein
MCPKIDHYSLGEIFVLTSLSVCGVSEFQNKAKKNGQLFPPK